MTIRTAIIGFGTGGRVFHAPLIAAEPRLAVSVIVTASPERAAAARTEYPDAEILAGVDELFARDDIDLVVVTSPNETHIPLAVRAVAAGIPVVIDKPIGVTSAEARTLLDAAGERSVAVTVFQNRRWDGDFLTARDVIASGAIGEVHQFESAFEWWKPELGGRWKDTATVAEGGGILYDLASHLVDQAVLLFGDVSTLYAELDRRRPGATSDDDSFLSLTHASGVRTRLWMSAVAPSNRPRLRIVGSTGVFVSQGLDPQEAQSIAGLRPHDQGFGVHADGRTAWIERPDGTREAVELAAGRHLAFYEGVADALTLGVPLPVDPSESVRVLEIIEQAIR